MRASTPPSAIHYTTQIQCEDVGVQHLAFADSPDCGPPGSISGVAHDSRRRCISVTSRLLEHLAGLDRLARFRTRNACDESLAGDGEQTHTAYTQWPRLLQTTSPLVHLTSDERRRRTSLSDVPPIW